MENRDYIRRLEYIDTRGVWPVYINGMIAITLVGKNLDITLDDARAVLYGE